LLLIFVGPVLLFSAYTGNKSGVVRRGIATYEREGEPVFYWSTMIFISVGGAFCLMMGFWMLFF